MNLIEALKVAICGGKIRNKRWGENEYAYSNGRHFIDENGNDVEIFLKDGWEIYTEPKRPIDELNKRFEEYRTTSNYPDYIMFEHLIKYLNEKENDNDT